MAGDERSDRPPRAGALPLPHAHDINRRIVEHTSDCVKILDLDGRLLYMNREGLRFLDVEESKVLAQPMAGFFKGDMHEQAVAAIEAARRGGSGRFQGRLQAASGEYRWFDIAVSPITDARGAVVQLLAVSRDVTERRRDDAWRAGQHEILEMIATGRLLPEVLDTLVRVVEDQCQGMRCSVLMLGDDGQHVRHCVAPSLPEEYIRAIDGSAIGLGQGSCGTAMALGSRVVVTDILTDPLWEHYRALASRAGFRACWSTPIFSPQRTVLGSFAMYYEQPRAPSEDELAMIESAADIARIAIEHQRAHQALQQSEARNRAMLRAIPDWMFLTTADGRFLDYHARDTSRLYVPPASFLGKTVMDVLPRHVADRLLQAFARVNASDVPETLEYTMASGDDERFYEACIVRCDGDKILSIVRDFTDRKRSELETESHRRQLMHLNRIGVVAELTGALAHELSQPLTAVRSNAQAAQHLLLHDSMDAGELRLAIDDIVRNNARAGAVVERLRALLRKDGPSVQRVDVNDVVREVLDLTRSEILSRRIRLTNRLAPDLRLVEGDRVQLQQVVLNLILNACDALDAADADRRELTLVTEMSDGLVQLVVADRGPGIPDNQLERVFEPFVTFSEQGLGLGLAISRSIVTAHRGSISAENSPGGGATFRCLLPAAAVTA